MIERSFVRIKSGLVHVAACGAGRADPAAAPDAALVGRISRGAAAPGCALSCHRHGYRGLRRFAAPAGRRTDSIEAWAEAAHEVLAALGPYPRRRRGPSHGGGRRGRDGGVAARAASRRWSCRPALRGCGATGEGARQARDRRGIRACRRPASPGIVGEAAAPFYPEGRGDLLERFIVDALKAGPRAAEGHRVVGRYVMEPRLPLVRCPTLVIAPMADPHAHPHAPTVAASIAEQQADRDRSGHGAASRPYAARLCGCDRPVPVEPLEPRPSKRTPSRDISILKFLENESQGWQADKKAVAAATYAENEPGRLTGKKLHYLNIFRCD